MLDKQQSINFLVNAMLLHYSEHVSAVSETNQSALVE